MAYIFRQKLNLSDLHGLASFAKKVLIYEPEDYLFALYRHYLLKHNFDVKHCPQIAKIRESVKNFSPDVLVFKIDGEPNTPSYSQYRFLPQLSAEFPRLKFVTTGMEANLESMKQLMSAGVSWHINRKFTRPQDMAVVIKNVLS